MSTPSPATIGQELLGELGHYLTSLEKPTLFKLKQLERAAEKLAGSNAAEAALARASIHALRWDVDAMHEQLRNLLHLDHGLDAMLNAGVLNSKVNEMEASLSYARRAFDLAPTNQRAADALMKALLQTGHLREVRRVLPTLTALSPEVRSACDVGPIIAMLDELGVDESRLQHELAAGYAVLRRNRVRVMQSRFIHEADPEDGSLSVSCEWTVDRGPSEEELLASEWVDSLLDSADWNPSQFTIDFVPMNEAFDELHVA